MTDNNITRTNEYIPQEAYDPYAQQAQGPSGGPVSPVSTVIRALRGRWIWAVLLGGLLGAAGGWAGWKIPNVMYRSSSWIEVSPIVKQDIVAGKEEVHPMFEAFIESQVTLAASRRVVDMAMDSPDWKKLGRARTDEDIAKFQKQLSALRPTRALYVQISFEDENPEAAMTAVNAVTEAYMKLVQERESLQDQGTIRLIENRKASLLNQLTEIRSTIESLTENRGADGLREQCSIALNELNAVEGDLSKLELDIAALKAADARAVSSPRSPPTEQQLALEDTELTRLLETRAAIERDLRALENQEKLGTKHPLVVDKRNDQLALDRVITQRVNALRAAALATPEERAVKLAEKEATRVRFVEVREKRSDDVRRLGIKRHKLDQLEADRENIAEQLDQVKKRYEQINLEHQNSQLTKIRVAQHGDRPVAPSSDKRASLAGLGGAAGMALGLGFILLLGLKDVRMRHIADVDSRASQGRFLGVLPDVIPGDTSDQADSSAAKGDFSIHHIRTMVQLRSRDLKRVVALTSPSSGAGKTTLSISLAESFAAAGSRTLLIDLDLVGHGLTSVMRSLVCEDASRVLVGSADTGELPKPVKKHRLSELLAARGRQYDDAQLSELLQAAREMTAAGDDACLRTVKALEGLARTTGRDPATAHRKRGILAAVDGVPLEECVLAVAQENLYVLPVGDARQGDAVRLSRDGLARLLNAAREKYDTVIIDTGPILGSIEAALVTSVCDAVLLVVTRGERQNLVNDALQRLEQIGADVAGVIFNRATIDDFIRSKHVSRSASVPVGVQ